MFRERLRNVSATRECAEQVADGCKVDVLVHPRVSVQGQVILTESERTRAFHQLIDPRARSHALRAVRGDTGDAGVHDLAAGIQRLAGVPQLEAAKTLEARAPLVVVEAAGWAVVIRLRGGADEHC